MPLGGLSALEAEGLVAAEGLGVGKAQDRKSSRILCVFDRRYEPHRAPNGPAVERSRTSPGHLDY